MKERPILFNTEMVQAVLAGKKTQTRRIVDHKKIAKKTGCKDGIVYFSDFHDSWRYINENYPEDWNLFDCPYGKEDDELWVRETFNVIDCIVSENVIYKASTVEKVPFKWKPSIFMPRKLSRIQLKINKVRVEKLQNITADDIRKEGAIPSSVIYEPQIYSMWIELWDSINADRGYAWKTNPDVWVIEFEVIGDFDSLQGINK